MYSLAKIVTVSAVAVCMVGSLFASDQVLVIKGKVTDDDGKPADSTTVRVKALDRHAPDKLVQTNSHGQFIAVGLVPGRYSVTAYDVFGNARSRALIESSRRGWANVNFDLRL